MANNSNRNKGKGPAQQQGQQGQRSQQQPQGQQGQRGQQQQQQQQRPFQHPVPTYQHVQGNTQPVVPVNAQHPNGYYYQPPPVNPPAPQQYQGAQVPIPAGYGYAFDQQPNTNGPHNPHQIPNPNWSNYPQRFQREHNPTMPPLGSVPIPIPGVRTEKKQRPVQKTTPEQAMQDTQYFMGVNGFPERDFTPERRGEAQARIIVGDRVNENKEQTDRNDLYKMGRYGKRPPQK